MPWLRVCRSRYLGIGLAVDVIGLNVDCQGEDMGLALLVSDHRLDKCPYGHGDYCADEETSAERQQAVPETVVCIECWERKGPSMYAHNGHRDEDYIL